MTRETLPARDDGEVWVKRYSERSSGNQKAYHTHKKCPYLKNSETPRTVPRRTLNQAWSICQRCVCLQDDGKDYPGHEGKDGPQLASLLEQDDVGPDNYQEKVAEWQANRAEDNP
jgi:hypothetical protein